MHITDLTSQEVRALARLLQLVPGEDPLDHSKRVFSSIANLTSDLKRPNALSRLILPSQNSYTFLCAIHKGLHASLVHAIFHCFVIEVGLRLNSLVANNQKLTRDQWTKILSLRKLHTLWLAPGLYEKTFLEPASDSKWPFQEDGCEACMLARMSGDLDVLLALRMVLLSRTRTKHPEKQVPPRIRVWIETWIATLATAIKLNDEDFERIISRNEKQAEELKVVRKSIWRERRKTKQPSDSGYASQTPSSIVPLSENPRPQPDQTPFMHPEEADTSTSFENDIIDHYAALVSTPHLPSLASQSSFRAVSQVPVHSGAPVHHPRKSLQPIPESAQAFTYPSSSVYSQSFPSSPNPDNANPSKIFFAPTSIYTQPGGTNPNISTSQYISPRNEWRRNPFSSSSLPLPSPSPARSAACLSSPFSIPQYPTTPDASQTHLPPSYRNRTPTGSSTSRGYRPPLRTGDSTSDETVASTVGASTGWESVNYLPRGTESKETVMTRWSDLYRGIVEEK